jgi:DNA-directed RNA polymerase I and III subunit RPAC1
MTTESVFKNIGTVKENQHMLTFQLVDTNVAYANTLRRMILTGVESVAFRSDMNEKGETSDVSVMENTTPMTNEMLADRIGLIPIHADPDSWKKDEYYFELKVENTSETTLSVSASDFQVRKRGTIRKQISMKGGANNNNQNLENEEGNNFENTGNGSNDFDFGTVGVDEYREPDTAVGNLQFFHPNPVSKETALIAMLKAKQPNQEGQKIHLIAVASVGTGRDHIRFSPVCQCSYGYTIDTDEMRQQEQFEKWVQTYKNKKPSELKEAKTAEGKSLEEVLKREFNTMEIQRCFKINPETGEPNSFDFVVESVGVQSVERIVEKALENIQRKCLKYKAIDREDVDTLRIQPADARMKGFDFIFQKEDHTLGNLLQTYMDENLMNKDVSFVGYKIPHPLRDEMVLRVGVDFPTQPDIDGKETTARVAVAKAASACATMFGEWLIEWKRNSTGPRIQRNLASLRPTAAVAKQHEQVANLTQQMAQKQQGGKRVGIKA